MQADQTTVVKTVVWVGIVLFVALLVSGVVVNSAVSKRLDSIDFPVLPTNAEFAKMIETEVGKITLPEMSEFPEYMISEDEYEENLIEDEAEKLALAELDSKDFRKLLRTKLNDKIALITVNVNEQIYHTIKSYKDIEDVYSVDVEDVSVVYDTETATVEIKFKVEYVLDDDEDLVGKARVTITYDVSGLDVDDDFEDAEADEEFTVIQDDIYLYKNLI